MCREVEDSGKQDNFGDLHFLDGAFRFGGMWGTVRS